MKRITVEEARHAYELTGLKPTQEITCDGEGACPIGAMYMAHHTAPIANCGLGSAANALGFYWKYASSFACGFDGKEHEPLEEAEHQGYADGIACQVLLGGI